MFVYVIMCIFMRKKIIKCVSYRCESQIPSEIEHLYIRFILVLCFKMLRSELGASNIVRSSFRGNRFEEQKRRNKENEYKKLERK